MENGHTHNAADMETERLTKKTQASCSEKRGRASKKKQVTRRSHA